MHSGQTVHLFDGQHRLLGKVVISTIEEGLVLGRFDPEPAFATLQPLFADFVEAVNQQLFHRVDEIDAALDALGFYLGSPEGVRLPPVTDVQIAGQAISLRIAAQSPETNEVPGNHPATVRT